MSIAELSSVVIRTISRQSLSRQPRLLGFRGAAATVRATSRKGDASGRTKLPVEPCEIGQLVVSVEAAGVGQHPGRRPADSLRLQSQGGPRPLEGQPPSSDAEDRDRAGPVAG